ncbi:hypothetical protein E3N88_06494 [Mikania micrantha]|uniref:Uncharacterized protein n=1 Tax=Mikania micrantha TaxID=192012 RepID=A0A5N6PNX6_9ASTR|nr:hypothetical protein E3N88_06494 [Mikania micrantha]
MRLAYNRLLSMILKGKTSAVCGPRLQTSFAEEVDQTPARRVFEGVCFPKTSSNQKNLFTDRSKPHLAPAHLRSRTPPSAAHLRSPPPPSAAHLRSPPPPTAAHLRSNTSPSTSEIEIEIKHITVDRRFGFRTSPPPGVSRLVYADREEEKATGGAIGREP